MTHQQSRREMLRSMSCGFGYLAFAGLASEAATKDKADRSGDGLASKPSHFPARAKRVIFLCMRGGPSHVDLFDYKPTLNASNGKSTKTSQGRGGGKWLGSPFRFKQHGESGLWFSELHPKLAKHADDICFLHSMNTALPNHPQAFGQMHTGSFQFVRPSLGAWTLYGLGTLNQNLPGFVTLNPPADFGGARNYGSSFLPAICQGTKIGGGQIPEIYAKFLGKDREPGPPLKNLSNRQLSSQQQRAQIDLIQALNRRKLARDQHHPEIEGAIETAERVAGRPVRNLRVLIGEASCEHR